MFDIGFAELLIIGVVALLVIGPERLPEAVRTASAWVNRIRRGFNDIKQEVQQELHNDSVMRDLRETGDSLRRESEALRSEMSAPFKELQDPGPGEQEAGDSTLNNLTPPATTSAAAAEPPLVEPPLVKPTIVKPTTGSTGNDASTETVASTEETPDTRRDD
jgi:sec-independent protein translocase protein TatB